MERNRRVAKPAVADSCLIVTKKRAKKEASWFFRRVALQRMQEERRATTATYRAELEAKIERRVLYTRLSAEPKMKRAAFRVRNNLTKMKKDMEIRHQVGFNTCGCVFDTESIEHFTWCSFWRDAIRPLRCRLEQLNRLPALEACLAWNEEVVLTIRDWPPVNEEWGYNRKGELKCRRTLLRPTVPKTEITKEIWYLVCSFW